MFVNESHLLWKELNERYGQTTAPRMFELHKSLTSTQQNDDSIAEYYGKLKSAWDQLQLLEGFPECSCGVMNNCRCEFLRSFLR